MQRMVIWLSAALLMVAGLSACGTKAVVPMSPETLDGSGLAQKIDNFVIVMDTSSSMKLRHNGHRKLDIAINVVEGFNQTVPPAAYTAGLRAFKARSELKYGMSAYSRTELSDGLAAIKQPGGLSRLDVALLDATEDLNGLSGQNAVFVVSDGGDVGADALAAARHMKETLNGRICIYTIQVGDDPSGAQSLESLANVSDCGGSQKADDLMQAGAMQSFVGAAFLGEPLDGDGDGVTDDMDRCPETLAGVQVDANGCPQDNDGDGVADYVDDCPGTASNTMVDFDGCPLDGDQDGVADAMDRCPETLAGVGVDANGCPQDNDGDGVADYVDDCPGTPAGAAVDFDGCPLDSDGDGVVDYRDDCPGTLAGAQVDASGCSLDTDNDGVPNSRDKCAATAAGTEVDYYGCPLPPPTESAEVTEAGTWIYKDVTFASGKADIRPSSYPVLNEIVDALKANPGLHVEIQGHTDNRGSMALNMRLSEARAQSVRQYMIDKGVAGDRMTAKGYGPNRPIAENDTAEGRARNRRVELKPIH